MVLHKEQTVRQLGLTEAGILAAPFGVYVADNIQKIYLFEVPGSGNTELPGAAIR